MDIGTFIESVAALFENKQSASVLLYAAATCLLTQIFKKIFVSKVKVDVLHKFDFAALLPFLFGTAFSAVDLIFVKKQNVLSFEGVYTLILGGATVGALAAAIFKFLSSLSGKSLKSLLKDDVFGAFYNQLLYFGTVKDQLVNKEISLKDFLGQVQLLSSNAKNIYGEQIPEEVKRVKLCKLLSGIVSDENISDTADVLHKALLSVSLKTK